MFSEIAKTLSHHISFNYKLVVLRLVLYVVFYILMCCLVCSVGGITVLAHLPSSPLFRFGFFVVFCFLSLQLFLPLKKIQIIPRLLQNYKSVHLSQQEGEVQHVLWILQYLK
eukprot:TRINITY_DN18445_c0_g3_i1.p1 TRINITY_DN18445_c0_g3~~TRINITY_DN18445_c0_g3_i1.p1  ORF type:complete len:112 (+),score=0.97 TRINITY_DN18445_c0_g3_i1:1865-2200(+)